MKLLIAILNDVDAEEVLRALVEQGFRATRIASTGGFLRSGTTTMLLGVEDAQVESAISLIRSTAGSSTAEGPQVTLFVVPVSRYEQV